MYCKNCGQKISDQAVICPYCGCATGKRAVNKTVNRPILGFILSFMIPIAGLIVSCYQYHKAKQSNGDVTYALAGIIIGTLGTLYSLMLAIVQTRNEIWDATHMVYFILCGVL